MRLGLVTYMWGAEWDLPTLIANLVETKFEGVELRTEHKHGVEPSLTDAQRAEVKKRFADSPVKLVGLGSTCDFHSPDPAVLRKNIEEAKKFIVLCHDVGGEGVKVRPNGLPKEVPKEKTLEQIGLALRELGKFGEGYGVELRLEVHGKESSQLPNIAAIMAAADHPYAKVCWNSNKEDMDGAGLDANFAMVAKKIGTVHIHDLISDYPWKQLFGLLQQSKFDGWTLLEEGNKTADPIRVMKYYRLLWEMMV